jgi:hypothetical protein
MKIKDGFMVREIAEQYVVVPVGAEVVSFNGMMHINESGMLLFRQLQKGCTEDDLVQLLLDTYDVTGEQAKQDVGNFIHKIATADLLV